MDTNIQIRSLISSLLSNEDACYIVIYPSSYIPSIGSYTGAVMLHL